MSDNCVFCKILAGELEASVVAEDENGIAIMDIAQFNVGHVLVIPRRHAVKGIVFRKPTELRQAKISFTPTSTSFPDFTEIQFVIR